MAKDINEIIDRAFQQGDYVDGRVFDRAQFRDAVKGLVADVEYSGDALIDAMGRIYVDGNHVGWVKRDAGLVELKALAAAMECNLPNLDAMLELTEVQS